MARVSTIVAVYNGAATVDRALSSIFAQTFTDNEIIVVNDGSTDDTPSVLSRYGDRIRVITQPNRGLSAARNAGVHASSGVYLAFLDDDDEWMPEKLARCVAVLEEDPVSVLAYTRGLKVDLQGRDVGSLDGRTEDFESPTLKQLLERPWNVVPSQFMVRRDVFERCGGFHEQFVTACEDRYFLLMVREHGPFRFVQEPLLRKTMHPLYPTVLQREAQYDLFVDLVRARYGSAAKGLIAEFSRERVKVLKQIGRLLMKEGRMAEARRCLARVIYYEPTSPRAYRKYLKSFFPTRAPRTTPRTGDGKA